MGDSSLFYKTTNSGNTWSRVAYFSFHNLSQLSFINGNIGFAVNGYEILKTTDGGITFLTTGIENFFPKSIQFLNNLTGYCSSPDSKIFKTTDGGDSWFLSYSFSSSQSQNPIFFINSETGYIIHHQNTYKTTNGGLNWNEYQNSLGLYAYKVKFLNEFTGYVTDFSLNYIKTTTGGQNWFIQSTDTLFNVGGVDFLDLNKIVSAKFFGQVSKTTNGGMNWINLTSGSHKNFTRISFPSFSTGYVLANEGWSYGSKLVKSTDQGQSWLEMPIVLPDRNYSLFFINNSTGYIGSIGGQLFKTTNGGINWTLNNTGINSDLFDIKFINANTGFMCVYKSIYKSTNGGDNWNQVYFNANGSYFSNLSFPSALTGYSLGVSFCKTTNGGNTWFSLTPPLGNNYLHNSIFFIDDNIGFTGGPYGQLSKTTNGGINWVTNLVNSNYALNSIIFVNNLTGYIAGFKTTGGSNVGIILKTTDQGNNWLRQNVIADAGLYDIHFFNNNIAMVVGDAGTILKTTSGGDPIGIQKIVTQIPNAFILNQNYPNPFNPITKIQFELPKKSVTRLIIYDALGKEITYLVNENLEEGVYETNWDASGYSSGIYFYKLIAGEYEESKKMVLIK